MIPKSLRQSLEHQDPSVLCEIKDLVEQLLFESGKLPGPAKLPEANEILAVENQGSMTYRLEKVSCGKNCKGCPHGPYWYAYWREGGKTRSKYIGKNLR